jgi:hypothetical protein
LEVYRKVHKIVLARKAFTVQHAQERVSIVIVR